MKSQELKDRFKEYCKVKGLTIDESRFEGEGENRHYVTAEPGSLCLKRADANTWAICQYGESGAINVLYGAVSTERMAGYLDATLCH